MTFPKCRGRSRTFDNLSSGLTIELLSERRWPCFFKASSGSPAYPSSHPILNNNNNKHRIMGLPYEKVIIWSQLSGWNPKVGSFSLCLFACPLHYMTLHDIQARFYCRCQWKRLTSIQITSQVGPPFPLSSLPKNPNQNAFPLSVHR